MEDQSITNRSQGLELDNDLKFHSTEQSFRGEIILRGLDNRNYRLPITSTSGPLGSPRGAPSTGYSPGVKFLDERIWHPYAR